MTIHIDLEECTGCGACVPACPFGLIDIVDDKAVIGEGCNFCGACQDACAFEAIIIERPEREAVAPDSGRGVWVFAEQRDGTLRGSTFELLAKGRELADALETELCAVCFGHNVQGVEELLYYGADKVYLAEDPAFADHQEDFYTEELVSLVREYKPEILLAAATSFGRSFIPRVAAILQTGLTADCTGLEMDLTKRLLLQTDQTDRHPNRGG